jgi:isocitrate/isopropylmalate dehydrogenase
MWCIVALGKHAAGERLTQAIYATTGAGSILTPDLGGAASTHALCNAISRQLEIVCGGGYKEIKDLYSSVLGRG